MMAAMRKRKAWRRAGGLREHRAEAPESAVFPLSPVYVNAAFCGRRPFADGEAG
jgi:hypothetical protein